MTIPVNPTSGDRIYREAREKAVLARADQIDDLVSAFLAELRVHVDLLRNEIESKESPHDHR